MCRDPSLLSRARPRRGTPDALLTPGEARAVGRESRSLTAGLAPHPTAADLTPSSRPLDGSRRNLVPEGLTRFTQEALPRQPPVQSLSPRVTCVLGHNPSSYTLNGTNIYVVGTGPRRVLIDTGEFGPREKVLATLRDAFRANNVHGLSEIVVTHLHHDHCALWESLRAEFGPCRISKWATPEWEVARRREAVRQARESVGVPADDTRVPSGALLTWQGLDFEDRSGYHRLSEGELISTHGATLRAFWTPGHAPDHVVLWMEEERSLFTGDNVLGWGTSWVDDLAAYMRSLHKIRLLGASRFYPGHGPCIHDAPERVARYISHRDQREAQVVAALMEAGPLALSGGAGAAVHPARLHGEVGLTSREVTRRLYPELRTDAAHDKAEGNVLKILVKLRTDGAAVSIEPEQLVPQSSLDEAAVEARVKETGSDGSSDPKVPANEYEKRWVAVLVGGADAVVAAAGASRL